MVDFVYRLFIKNSMKSLYQLQYIVEVSKEHLLLFFSVCLFLFPSSFTSGYTVFWSENDDHVCCNSEVSSSEKGFIILI